MTHASQVLSVSSLAGRTGSGLRIAVIDTGIHAGHPHIGGIETTIGFDHRGVEEADAIDRLGHGTAVAAVIHEKAPGAAILAVRIFDRQMKTTGAALESAIRWAVNSGADIVNLSLGTTNVEHRTGLEAIVADALNDGILIVAAAPTISENWLPGALAGVIGVELDWTCPREECVILRQDGRIRMRASGYPRPIPGVPPERNLKGQSFAVANATGLLTLSIEGRDRGSRAILPGLR